MRQSKITRQQFDILNFHPESLRYSIFSRFNKIAEENKAEKIKTTKQLNEIEQVMKHSPFTTTDYFITCLKDTKTLLGRIETMNTSERAKEPIIDVLTKSLNQIEELFDLFKIKNFGSADLDYYQIQNQIDEFMDNFIAEHQKDENTINYDILNSDLKTNYIIQKLLKNRISYLTKLVDDTEKETEKEKDFVFNRDEISIIRDSNFNCYSVMNGAKGHLDQKTFTDTPITLLADIYDKHEKIYTSGAVMTSSNRIAQKSAIKVISRSRAFLQNNNKELYKYQRLDEINFKLFSSRFNEFLETEQILFNFK